MIITPTLNFWTLRRWTSLTRLITKPEVDYCSEIITCFVIQSSCISTGVRFGGNHLWIKHLGSNMWRPGLHLEVSPTSWTSSRWLAVLWRHGSLHCGCCEYLQWDGGPNKVLLLLEGTLVCATKLPSCVGLLDNTSLIFFIHIRKFTLIHMSARLLPTFQVFF